MLKRISTSLFNHRLIGQFISDKMWIVISYFFVLLAFLSIPSIVSLSNEKLMDGEEYTLVQNEVLKTNEVFKIENFKMTSTSDFYFETDSYIYAFNTSGFTSKILFCFSSNEVSVVEYGIKICSKTYEELGVSNLTVSNQNPAVGINLIQLIEKTADSHLNEIKAVLVVGDFLNSLIDYIIIILILFMIGRIINPNVTSLFRLRVVIYSITSLLVCDLIARVVGFSLIYYLGVGLSCVALFRSLRAIIKIEVKKR